MSLRSWNNYLGRRSLRDRFPDMVQEGKRIIKQQKKQYEDAKELSIDDFVDKHGAHNLEIWWIVNKMKGETNDNS
jgi:hypothetical protein